MMHKRTLGQGLEVSAIGLGCMGMSQSYGPYANEELVGVALARMREQGVIATKFGCRIEDGKSVGLDSSPAQIKRVADQSLGGLGVEMIDLFYQHRVDPGVPSEEVAGAVGELVAAGKVRHLGLSECSAATLRKAHAVHPVTAVQSEYSLWTRDPGAGVLPACGELGVGFAPFSPLGRGVLTGTVDTATKLAAGDVRKTITRFGEENLSHHLALVDYVTGLAQAEGVAPGQIALARLLAQQLWIVPIPGTRRRERLEQNAGATRVALSADELADLTAATDRIGVHGNRYNDLHVGLVGR